MKFGSKPITLTNTPLQYQLQRKRIVRGFVRDALLAFKYQRTIKKNLKLLCRSRLEKQWFSNYDGYRSEMQLRHCGYHRDERQFSASCRSSERRDAVSMPVNVALLTNARTCLPHACSIDTRKCVTRSCLHVPFHTNSL